MGPTVVQTFAALADPVRSTMVDRLADEDATVGELAANFAMSFQAVSQHIGVLERAGLVTRTREGRTRRVHLEIAPFNEAMTWMESRRQRLEARYRRLDEVLMDLTRASTRTDPSTDKKEPWPNTTSADPAAPPMNE